MQIQEIKDLFLLHPNKMNKGANKLAERFGVNKNDIYKIKEEVREILCNDEKAELVDIIIQQEEVISELLVKVSEQETDHSTGNKKIILESNKPLTPKEIESWVGVDNITSFVDRSWLKSHKNQTWTYSILTVNKIKDFYSGEELKEKLKELFPTEIKPFIQTKISDSENTLVVYLSDDHLGLLLQDGSYTKSVYLSRLQKIANSIVNAEGIFNEIVIVSLGDQLNGWNNETTRGGHKLGSKSNKEQFDDYVSSRKEFYDILFSSGCARYFRIIEVNNSNHSGLDFSYMANEWLKLYTTSKYPFVQFQNSTKLITQINLNTGHILFAVHGKDEKHQKTPMPLFIDNKTETYFMDYILEQGINPKLENVSVVKADSHRYAESEAKSFRYVSTPSIADGSDWQIVNFGSSKAGTLLEVFQSGEPEPFRKIVRFK